MLSRAANNLIWIERYMERGNGLISLLKVNFSANQDSPELFSWTPIIKNYNASGKECFTEDAIQCIEHLIFDAKNSNSILNLVTKARENARSVQEHISRELWLCINNYYLYLTQKDLIKKLQTEDPVVFLDELKKFHLIYLGTMDSTQERGPSYYFMNVGRFLERVIQISEFTAMKLIEVANTSDSLEQSFYWKNLLLSVGGYQYYLKTHKSSFQENHVIKMLFQDQLFPRSMYYCVNKLSRSIQQLIEIQELEKQNTEFLLGKLESTIKYSTFDSINEKGLNKFILGIKKDIKNISLSINTVYFSHSN